MRRMLKQVPYNREFLYGGVLMSVVEFQNETHKGAVQVKDRHGKRQWLDWNIEVEIPTPLKHEEFSGFCLWNPEMKSRPVHSRLVIVRSAVRDTAPVLWEVDGQLGYEELQKYYGTAKMSAEQYTLFQSLRPL